MLWPCLELWKSSEKDLFGIMIILVMLIGTGTIIYILIWFKDDPNSSKSKSRMDKIESSINQWQIKSVERRQSEYDDVKSIPDKHLTPR